MENNDKKAEETTTVQYKLYSFLSQGAREKIKEDMNSMGIIYSIKDNILYLDLPASTTIEIAIMIGSIIGTIEAQSARFF